MTQLVCSDIPMEGHSNLYNHCCEDLRAHNCCTVFYEKMIYLILPLNSNAYFSNREVKLCKIIFVNRIEKIIQLYCYLF